MDLFLFILLLNIRFYTTNHILRLIVIFELFVYPRVRIKSVAQGCKNLPPVAI